MNYLIKRLTEKSTFFGLVGAVSVIGGFSVPDEKISAAFFLVSFLAGILTAATKENGSAE